MFSLLPGPRPPLVWALPLLKVEDFCLNEPTLNREFRFSLVRSSFLGAETGESTAAEEKKTIWNFQTKARNGGLDFYNKCTDRTWGKETKFKWRDRTEFSLFLCRIIQFGPAPCQLWWAVSGCHSLNLVHSQDGELGGGSLKGIKTSPTKQIQGYIIQNRFSAVVINKFSLLLQRQLIWSGILHVL